MSRTRVVYVAGWGRSGSTILDNLLGQVDHFFSAGELVFLWERGLLERWPCGCGAPVTECAVWRGVLRRAFGPDGADAARIVALQRSSPRIRHLPLLALERARWPAEYRDAVERLYPAIAEETGARVIVDSSKSPVYAHLLQTLPAVELYVVHLVRDPRAVAYSWQRRKLQPDERPMLGHRALYSSLMWDIFNEGARMLRRRAPSRYLRLRYEDFVAEPRAAVERIVAFAGEEAEALSFVGESAVELAPTHTVSGNPSRFATGLVELRPDLEWTERLSRRDRLVATLTTSPLLRRYGYPLRPAGGTT